MRRLAKDVAHFVGCGKLVTRKRKRKRRKSCVLETKIP